MATTYQLISSQTLTSDTALVTFSSIPSTFSDLVFKCSVRGDTSNPQSNMDMVINNNTNAVYTYQSLEGYGAGGVAATSQGSGAPINSFPLRYTINAATSTANTFSNLEMYFASYANSLRKSINVYGAQENENTTAYLQNFALMYMDTTPISRLDFRITNGSNYVTGSKFYLYGVKNT